MLPPQDAKDLLQCITFKIRIEKNKVGAWEWGTGFFISKDGCALTAFHNLPAAVVQAGSGTVDACYKGQWIKLECLVAESLPEHEGDIALLKWQQPSNLLEFCPVATLDLNLSRQERSTFWAGRPVCAFGFPFEQHGQGERFVDGIFDSTQPLVEIDIKNLHRTGISITGKWSCRRTPPFCVPSVNERVDPRQSR